MKKKLIWATHNCLLHPIAGLFWLAGFKFIGDIIHELLLLDISEENKDCK
jgi:hypothetical protein